MISKGERTSCTLTTDDLVGSWDGIIPAYDYLKWRSRVSNWRSVAPFGVGWCWGVGANLGVGAVVQFQVGILGGSNGVDGAGLESCGALMSACPGGGGGTFPTT